jgi:hypothetical protein
MAVLTCGPVTSRPYRSLSLSRTERFRLQEGRKSSRVVRSPARSLARWTNQCVWKQNKERNSTVAMFDISHLDGKRLGWARGKRPTCSQTYAWIESLSGRWHMDDLDPANLTESWLYSIRPRPPPVHPTPHTPAPGTTGACRPREQCGLLRHEDARQ